MLRKFWNSEALDVATVAGLLIFYGARRIRMAHPAEVAKFQLQVIRSFKAGLAKAQEKVKFYERMAKSPDADEGVKFAIKHHQNEVRMYKALLASALKKR